jgi:hypothetical protein
MGGAYSMYRKERGAYRALVGKTEGKRLLGGLWCVDREIILEWILNNRMGGCGLD